MAGIRDSELESLQGWPKGIDNLSKETEVPADSVRAAENVDFDNDGKPTRKHGATLVEALPGLHSLWSHDNYRFMLGVHDFQLLSWDAEEEKEVMAALLDALAPMSFDFGGGKVFFCNGVDSGLITALNVVMPWAVETPGGPSELGLVINPSAGGLDAGDYQVALTYIDDSGRESGSTPASVVTLETGQGISLTHIPQPLSGDIAYIRVYVSPANGDVLYFCRDVVPGTASLEIGVHTPGKALETMFLKPLPAGQIVRLQNFRQHVARGPVHYWSESGRYGLGKPQSNYVRYGADITLMEPAGQGPNAGFFLAADQRTYFMQGPDPKSWTRVIAYPHGAAPGSSGQADLKDLGLDGTGLAPYWLADNGQTVVGLPDGTIVPLHQTRYVAPVNVQSAASVLRESRGVKHLIMALRGGETSTFRATDTATAVIVKNGIVGG